MAIDVKMLAAILLLQTLAPLAFAAGEGAGSPPGPPSGAGFRTELHAAAGDSLLQPWQREYMRRMASGPRADPAVLGSEAGAVRTLDQVASGPDGAWTKLATFSARAGLSSVYDPLRNRMLIFGGWDGCNYRNDVWALSLTGAPAWTRLTPTGLPPMWRVGSSAIYDPVRDRILIFGGYCFDESDRYLNDVWELTLRDSVRWNWLWIPGPSPAGRYYHTAVYDLAHDQMVVFGGAYSANGSPHYLDDVWALSLGDGLGWRRLVPAGTAPAGRFEHAAICDAAHHSMVVFGGYRYDNGPHYLDDAWVLSLEDTPAWSALSPAGASPAARAGHSAVYDAQRDRMVLFGGDWWDGSYHFLDDVWALSLGATPSWTALVTVGSAPAPRSGQTAIFDSGHDSLVVFGGYELGDAYHYFGDVWALSLADPLAWTPRAPAGSPPVARAQHAAIYDIVRDRLVTFGGHYFADDSFHWLNDTWVLPLSGTPEWSPLLAGGTPPPARSQHTAIYDPVRDRALVFGGYYYDGAYRYLNDVWALALAGTPAWTPLAPAGAPPHARSEHASVYDPVRDRMLVLGGFYYDGIYHYLGDVWALSLAGGPSWSQLLPAGTPPSARYGHSAVYDPARDRLIVYGGWDSLAYRDDAWALSLSDPPTWTELQPGDTLPPPRAQHSAVYDPVDDRMLVFGGYDYDVGTPFLGDTWSLALSGSGRWTQLQPTGFLATSRYWHAALYDPGRSRMLVFGGKHASYQYLDDVWSFGVPEPLAVPGRPDPGGLRLAESRPNPARGGATIHFDVPRQTHVTLRIYDLAGRRVLTLKEAELSAGHYEERWNGHDEQGAKAAPGVYLCVLSAGTERAVKRLVLLR